MPKAVSVFHEVRKKYSDEQIKEMFNMDVKTFRLKRYFIDSIQHVCQISEKDRIEKKEYIDNITERLSNHEWQRKNLEVIRHWLADFIEGGNELEKYINELDITNILKYMKQVKFNHKVSLIRKDKNEMGMIFFKINNTLVVVCIYRNQTSTKIEKEQKIITIKVKADCDCHKLSQDIINGCHINNTCDKKKIKKWEKSDLDKSLLGFGELPILKDVGLSNIFGDLLLKIILIFENTGLINYFDRNYGKIS